jgi:hypothetical protein
MIETTELTVSPLSLEEMMAPAAFVDRLQKRALLVGIVGIALAIVGAATNLQQFYRSYLVAYMLVQGLGLGCLGLLMVQYMTKGNWGFVHRRQYEAGSRTVWLLAILFVPIAIAMWTGSMYPWAISDHLHRLGLPYLGVPGGLTEEQSHAFKYHLYLTPSFTVARAAIYFLIWGGLAIILSRWGGWQDVKDEQDLPRSRRFQKVAGPGLILFAYTVSLAVTDWVQSLDAGWFSTMYGLIFVVAEALIAMCFCILLTNAMAKYKPVSDIMQAQFWHDLGNLTLAMVMLFAYFGFSQFLIIWSGNLPEEIEWFHNRVNGGWGAWGFVMVLTMFAIPFFLLLHKPMKRNPKRLIWIAGILILGRWVDMVWYIMPNFAKVDGMPNMRMEFHFSWQTVVLPIGMAGLWIWAFCRELKKRPLYPKYDLLWPEITREHHGH